jgi:hypothetical protein
VIILGQIMLYYAHLYLLLRIEVKILRISHYNWAGAHYFIA